MFLFELTDDERRIVEELLRSELTEVRDEIYRSETPSFRDDLKSRKTTLEALLEKVEAQPPATSTVGTSEKRSA